MMEKQKQVPNVDKSCDVLDNILPNQPESQCSVQNAVSLCVKSEKFNHTKVQTQSIQVEDLSQASMMKVSVVDDTAENTAETPQKKIDDRQFNS